MAKNSNNKNNAMPIDNLDYKPGIDASDDIARVFDFERDTNPATNRNGGNDSVNNTFVDPTRNSGYSNPRDFGGWAWNDFYL